ncbi:MAG: hypothetical protein RLZZ627_1847 [Pseudomonadota bacterium]|jgi:hypothetical protein
MSIQASLIKAAIKMTPTFLITMVANVVLRGIAKLNAFDFDLESRRLRMSVRLLGEPEDIVLHLDNFGVTQRGDQYYFILRSAQSNKPWLNNLMAHVTHQCWPIPRIPQLAPYMGLVNELLELP